MAKKILILNGSPRKHGNTAALIDAFEQGAASAGHDVMRFDLQAMDIAPCIGCLGGGKDRESPCTQKDAMDSVYPAYREADIIVLASPLYFWGFTAQLKAAIDRLFAAMEGEQEATEKGCIMLLVAGGDTNANCKPMVDYYESLAMNVGWQNLGMVLAGGAYRLGEIEGNPALEEARKLGASIG